MSLIEEQRAPTPLRADALPLRLMVTVWLPFAIGYFLSYSLRNVNAVLAPELTSEFALSAADLGLLTSAYYVAFALVQLPAGVLLDRYGPRRVHAALMLVAAAGCALHAFGRSFPELAFGRALVGIGVSVALMSAAKAFSQWLPMTRVPLSINLLLTCGGLGAIVAAGPVGWALDYVSWRVVLGVAAVLLVSASGFLYFVVPDRRESSAQDSLAQLAAGFGTIFANGTFWRLALMMATVSGAYSAVQSLWIGPWLRDVGGLARDQVIIMITWFALASTLGYAAIGAGMDWLIRRGASPLALYKVQCGVAILIFGLITITGGNTAVALWIAYFVVGSGGALVLAILARTFPTHLTGRVNTATNVLMFSFAFAFQWGIGAILDLWPAIDGRYAIAGYRAGLGALLVAQLAIYALLLIWENPSRSAARATAGRS